MSAATNVGEMLFATDFSESSDTAARVARDYARRFGARLHLLHVVWAGSDPVVPPMLQKLADDLGREVPVVTSVESGAPAAEIVKYARRHGIGLIVVGTHGRTGATRALLGSVAERVVRTAPCPVLTVPRETGPAATEAAAHEPEELRRCLVCTKPSDDLICDTCRTRIRAEALERKRKEERAGRG